MLRERRSDVENLLAAVGKVGADVEPRLLAELHLDDALIPAWCESALMHCSHSPHQASKTVTV